jgi:hypothetical protein
MLSALVFAAAAALPSPSPAPTTVPHLKEIAHVRSTSACGEIAAHANAAIGDALGNDAVLDQTISALRDRGLDGNAIERRHALERLTQLSNRLAVQYADGNGEIRRLRVLADRASTPAAKSNLLAFANWLGGALWRQQRVDRDLDGFIATLDAKDMARFDGIPANLLDASSEEPTRGMRPNVTPPLGGLTVSVKLDPRSVIYPPQPAQSTDGQMALAAAADFVERTAAIQSDESMAASHASALDTGC